MAEITEVHIFNGSIENVFRGICDYKSYPEFLPGVTKVEIGPPLNDSMQSQVRYEINLIKKFYYVLNMYAESPKKLWWELHESNLMQKSSGSWTLRKLKGGVEGVYKVDIKFRGLVPNAVTDKVAQANLPQLMKGFQTIIDRQSKA